MKYSLTIEGITGDDVEVHNITINATSIDSITENINELVKDNIDKYFDCNSINISIHLLSMYE